VLALEALRALGGGDGAALLRAEARTLAAAAREPRLARVAGGAMAALDRALARAAEGGDGAEAGARRIALAIGFAMETLLLAAQAQRALDDDERSPARRDGAPACRRAAYRNMSDPAERQGSRPDPSGGADQ
jgi:hypothetical protein